MGLAGFAIVCGLPTRQRMQLQWGLTFVMTCDIPRGSMQNLPFMKNRILSFTSLSLLWIVCVPALLAEAEKPTPTLANVAYGSHARQVLDFYQAKDATVQKPSPLLFFIHGGGWMNGDKANPDFLKNCLEAGISVVSINYRLLPDAIEQKIYPPVKACLEDSARALQFVRSQAGEWHIDKGRIAGCGGSAGGFNVLWLAYHPDMADAKSADPIARESTRLSCVLAFVPQTSLDPRQMRDWISNNDYGHHAFSLPSYQDFLNKREELMPWIKQFSPYELATGDDPPVYLFYDSAVVMGQAAQDPPHSANFGAGLVEKLKQINAPHIFNYKGATEVQHPDLFSFIITQLAAGR